MEVGKQEIFRQKHRDAKDREKEKECKRQMGQGETFSHLHHWSIKEERKIGDKEHVRA